MECTENAEQICCSRPMSTPVICRVCTAPTPPDASWNLFECQAADGYSLAQLVALVGDIEVRPDEADLSAWCCVQCQLDVGAAYRVRVLCQESDRKLREMLEAAVVETSSVCQIEEESSTLQHTDAFEEIPNTKQRCCGCHQLFDTVEELVAHSTERYAVAETPMATKDREVCDVCYRLVGKRYMELHKQSPKTLFRCKACGELFLAKRHVTRHAKVCSSGQVHSPPSTEENATFKCSQCRKKFRTQKSLRAHEYIHHNSFSQKCTRCAEVFTDFNEYRTHLNSHRKNKHDVPKRHQCFHCPASFNHKSSMSRHVKKYHLEISASAENNHSRTEDTEEGDDTFEEEVVFKIEVEEATVEPEVAPTSTGSRTEVTESGEDTIEGNVVLKIEVEDPVETQESPEEDEDMFEEDDVCKNEVEDPAKPQETPEEDEDTLDAVWEIKDGRKVDVVESENDDDDDDEEAESSAVDDSPAHESELFQEIKAVDQRRCCSCLLIFPNESSLLEHAEQVHKVDDPPKEDAVNNKLCNVCYKLINKTNYVRHGRLPKTLFRCTACDDLFFSKKLVLKHYRWDHYSPRKCCTCKQKFKTVEALRQHSNEVHLPKKRKPDKNRPYGCNLCYKTFKNKGSRDNHRSRAFNYFSCSKCKKSFSLLRQLRLHEETHADPTVNVCPYCAKAFDDRIKCERHVRDVHEQSRHHCEPCGKAYKCRKTLIRHNIVEHGIPGPYACDRCPVSFALAGEVKDHRRKFHPDGVGSSEDQAMEMEEEGEASWECKLEVEEPKLVGFEDSEEEEEDDGAKA